MFDPTSPHDRIISATLKLAEERDWSDIDLSHIAAAAEIDLIELRKHFESPSDILKAFSAAVDREVLKRAADDRDDGDVARDRLFDVLMTRFEVLQPYKPALKSLGRNPALALEMTPVFLNAQRWMLEAAGISTSGSKGRARMLGTSAVYARVMQTWLDDDDAGMAKTMAALDSRLRRGEKVMQRADDAFSVISGLGSAIFSRRSKDRKPDAEKPDEPGPDTPANAEPA